VILYGFSIRTLTDFMIEKTKLYNKFFVSKEKLYTLDQVHMEIHNIVDAVSETSFDNIVWVTPCKIIEYIFDKCLSVNAYIIYVHL